MNPKDSFNSQTVSDYKQKLKPFLKHLYNIKEIVKEKRERKLQTHCTNILSQSMGKQGASQNVKTDFSRDNSLKYFENKREKLSNMLAQTDKLNSAVINEIKRLTLTKIEWFFFSEALFTNSDQSSENW